MNGRWVYPQLDPLEASRLFQRITAGTVEPATRWPTATPSPTGAVAPEKVLTAVRQAVSDALSSFPGGGPVSRVDAAAWDKAAGEALHTTMAIIPADAAREGVWSFLTLVLLPDFAVQRFPEMHRNRMLGHPRNVFRRVWWRREILGQVGIPDGVRPLGEDEYVNIFERSHLSRCRPLARVLATTILGYRGTDRSEFARELAKAVRRQTGPHLLDVLPESALHELVLAQALKLGAVITGPAPTGDAPKPKPPPPEHRRATPSMPADPRRKRAPAQSSERTPSDAGRGPRPRSSYSETLSDLVSDGRLPVGAVLTGRYRGIDCTVTVTADGTLRDSDGGEFATPSEACRIVTGQNTVNGWTFWLIGDVPIGELRRT